MSHADQANIPDWITATVSIIGMASIPFVWAWRRINGSVSRKHFETYLRERDALAAARHHENRESLKALDRRIALIGERVARLEGKLDSRYP